MARVYGASGSGGTTGLQGSRIWIDYSWSQNLAGNYTDVSWVVGVDYGDPNYWHNLSNGSFGAAAGDGGSITSGTSSWSASGYYYGTSNPGNGGGDHALASGTYRVTHGNNGVASTILTASSQLSNGSYTSSPNTGWFLLPTIPRQPSAPGTPSVSGHTDSNPTTATISWTAPSDVGAGLANRHIQISTNSGFSSTVVDSEAAWGTSYNASGLSKNTLYYVRVRASSSAGYGPFSATQSFTTGTTAPGQVDTPWTGTITYTTINVNWNPPSDNGGTAITNYTVERATNSGFTTGVQSYSAGTATSYTITGLTATTAYWVRVRATNATGTGSNSIPVATGTQTATAPSAPAAPTFTNVLGTSLTVNWTAPATNGAAITGYTLQRSTTSGSSGFSDLITGISAASTNVQVTSLDYGVTYWFRLVANSSVGNTTGASASVTMGTTTPFAPAVPTISLIGQISARVSYTAPDSGGSAITGYDIQRATDAAFTTDVVTTPDAASPLDITGLAPATAYYVRVRAKNANGNGAWSSSASFTALASAYLGASAVGCQVIVRVGTSWVIATTQKWNGSAWV